VYGLFVFGATTLIGLLGGAAVLLLTKSGEHARHLTLRIALLGLVLGAAAALGRWLCGGSAQRLLSWRFIKGDVAALAALLGVVAAGALAERLGAEEVGQDNRLAIGQPMDISGPKLDGGRFDLADYRGKVVLVDFWATWCPPCVAELPHVRAAYDQYHGDGLEVVSVSLDYQRPALVKFLEARPMPWPQVFFDEANSRGWDNPLARRYGIDAIPCLLVIDREGKLAAQNVHGKEIAMTVAESLGQSVSWGDRVAHTGARAVTWLFQGILSASIWLVLLCGLGGGLLGATVEAAVRRAGTRGQVAGNSST
jgi:thiol-disulfide isomerase/thioredoxin